MAEYVEREQAINFARAAAAAAYNRDDFGAYRDLNAFIATIIFIPAADVAPVVHGHWKHVAGMNSKCSVCERYFPVNEFVKRPFDINYCPNCGAKMDKEEEND